MHAYLTLLKMDIIICMIALHTVQYVLSTITLSSIPFNQQWHVSLLLNNPMY